MGILSKIIKLTKQGRYSLLLHFMRQQPIRMCCSFLVFVQKKKIKNKINRIVNSEPNKKIIIFPPQYDWNMPMKQRHQHMAAELSKEFIYFYCTQNKYDRVVGVRKIEGADKSLYLANCYELLKEISSDKIFHWDAHMSEFNDEEFEFIKASGSFLLYDYIDEICEELSGEKYQEVELRHQKVLFYRKAILVASSMDLLKKVKAINENIEITLIRNGVEVEHFLNARRNIGLLESRNQKKINDKEQLIVGYYGAIASWLDLGLVEQLAQEFPHQLFLIVGWAHDDSILSLRALEEKYSNIILNSAIPYSELPSVAQIFDVSIIPFVSGELANATNPIKFYEYMALGRPIITSKLKECEGYRGVYVSSEASEFIEKLRYLLEELGLDEHKERFGRDYLQSARQNSWHERGKLMISLVKDRLAAEFRS